MRPGSQNQQCLVASSSRGIVSAPSVRYCISGFVWLAAAKSIPGVSAEGAGEVSTLARCAMQETAAAVLPFRDESGVKAYLLDGAQRQKALAEQAVLPSTAKGALGALALLRERCFLCLHYRLGPKMQLTPCTAADT